MGKIHVLGRYLSPALHFPLKFLLVSVLLIFKRNKNWLKLNFADFTAIEKWCDLVF